MDKAARATRSVKVRRCIGSNDSSNWWRLILLRHTDTHMHQRSRDQHYSTQNKKPSCR